MNSLERSTIESLAYFIYLNEGRPEGRALNHWLEAEKQIEAECQFEAESLLEPNIFGDKAVEHLKIGGSILSADGLYQREATIKP